MTKNEPFDPERAKIRSQAHKLEEKFSGSARPKPSNEELFEWAREEMKRLPEGNPNPRRIDAPLRSALDPEYIAEKVRADSKLEPKP